MTKEMMGQDKMKEKMKEKKTDVMMWSGAGRTKIRQELMYRKLS